MCWSKNYRDFPKLTFHLGLRPIGEYKSLAAVIGQTVSFYSTGNSSFERIRLLQRGHSAATLA
jgi:hypothetical protein